MTIAIDLAGRTALVTGGTGQLGRAIVRTLGRAGADVAVHYRSDRARAEELCAELRAQGRRAEPVSGDIGTEEGVAAIRVRMEATLGMPGIVVANAVQQYAWTSVLEQPIADFESQFRTCTVQAVLLAKAFVPAMAARGGGRLIAINTECSMQCAPNQGAYVGGKRGLDGVLRVLAREVGPQQVTVNQVAPGWMRSDKYRGEGAGGQPDVDPRIALHRRGDDQDIADAVVFLASDLAGFITGCYLPVCGGSVMPTI